MIDIGAFEAAINSSKTSSQTDKFRETNLRDNSGRIGKKGYEKNRDDKITCYQLQPINTKNINLDRNDYNTVSIERNDDTASKISMESGKELNKEKLYQERITELEEDLEYVLLDAAHTRAKLNHIVEGMHILTRMMKRNNFEGDNVFDRCTKDKLSCDSVTKKHVNMTSNGNDSINFDDLKKNGSSSHVSLSNGDNLTFDNRPTLPNTKNCTYRLDDTDDHHRLSELELIIGNDFFGLSSACRMLKQNANLLSIEASMSTKDITSIVQKSKEEEERAEKADIIACKMISHNKALVSKLAKIKKQKRFLIKVVKSLIRERFNLLESNVLNRETKLQGVDDCLIDSLIMHEANLLNEPKQNGELQETTRKPCANKSSTIENMPAEITTIPNPLVSPLSISDGSVEQNAPNNETINPLSQISETHTATNFDPSQVSSSLKNKTINVTKPDANATKIYDGTCSPSHYTDKTTSTTSSSSSSSGSRSKFSLAASGMLFPNMSILKHFSFESCQGEFQKRGNMETDK